MNIKDRVIKSKTDLMGRPGEEGFPFFAYLVLHLNEGNEIEQDSDISTAGVNAKGHMVYNPEWMDSLTDEQIKFVLVHEVMHLAIQHIFRCGSRDKALFNIAGDIWINNALIQNGLIPPAEIIIPKDNKVELFGGMVEIVDIDKKFSESIYDELYHQMKQKGLLEEVIASGYGMKGKGAGKSSEKLPKSLDYHEYGDSKGENGQDSAKAKRELESIGQQWSDRLVEAANRAKMQGHIPAGMNRIIDKILNKKLNWRNILYKYITNSIKYDTSWSKFSRRSISTGVWLPGPVKEGIEVVVAVDTSRSISQKELTEFLGEIVSIGKSFNNIEITVIVGDADLQNEYVVRNGDIPKILSMKISGGGGTSHKFVMNYVNEKKAQAKVLVCLTDGYSDLETTQKDLPGSCDLIVCLSENGKAPEELKVRGKVIKMED